MRSGELARRFGVTDATIRQWSERYAEFLSERARPGEGRTRVFTEEDARVLGTVAYYTQELGVAHEETERLITQGKRIEEIPDLPTAEEEEARANVALVPVARLEAALVKVQSLEEEMARVISERDDERLERKEAEKRINELEREVGYLKGRIEEIEKRRGLFKR
jgi:DNA-binding transcriptional MerR regulator